MIRQIVIELVHSQKCLRRIKRYLGMIISETTIYIIIKVYRSIT